jgi:hypothetical protein
VLAKMLSLDPIDPFDSPEAKPHKTDPDILALTSLLHVSTQSTRSCRPSSLLVYWETQRNPHLRTSSATARTLR